MPKVAIIGAGLAGSLLAIYLAKRGITVDVYEARGDIRREAASAGRSINLALSDRGIAALRGVGMDDYMLAEAVPMYGRMIHGLSGETKLLPYSGREGEYINSVSRAGLNVAIIDAADKFGDVTFHFGRRCTDFDCETGEVVFAGGRVHSETVIGTDGAGSAVRRAVGSFVKGFDASQEWLDHGYKELHIPPGVKGEFQLEKNALHIWPRNQFMMIALPNFDGSFTCTLFIAHRGDRRSSGKPGVRVPAFDQLKDASSVLEFFNDEFQDAVPLMPTLTDDFFANPIGVLGTVKCYPWNVGGRALLLGDAAHALVPFYGQGMNCAFEDVRVLDNLIEEYGTDWKTVYENFGQLRKENTDAIADMAVENFYEMRDATADPVFQRKRELETKLEQTYPEYFSKYSMVTFREDLPYSAAKRKGNAQDELLMEICRSVDDVGAIDFDDVITQVEALGA